MKGINENTEIINNLKENIKIKWEPLKDINYDKDTERYDDDFGYCGTCKYSLDSKKGIYRCEECDDSFGESEHTKDSYGETMSLRFHRDCPCYCYICIECDSNVLETDLEDDAECEYGNHKEKRQRLLSRLNELDSEAEEFAYQPVNEAQQGVSVGDCKVCDHPLIQWDDDEAKPANQGRIIYKNKYSTADNTMDKALYFIIYPYDDRYETTNLGGNREEGRWIKICVYCFSDMELSLYYEMEKWYAELPNRVKSDPHKLEPIPFGRYSYFDMVDTECIKELGIDENDKCFSCAEEKGTYALTDYIDTGWNSKARLSQWNKDNVFFYIGNKCFELMKQRDSDYVNRGYDLKQVEFETIIHKK